MTTILFALAIASIIYVMIFTRPNVFYALSVSSQYETDHGMAHLVAAKNILKYLNRIKEFFLVYEGDDELNGKPPLLMTRPPGFVRGTPSEVAMMMSSTWPVTTPSSVIDI